VAPRLDLYILPGKELRPRKLRGICNHFTISSEDSRVPLGMMGGYIAKVMEVGVEAGVGAARRFHCFKVANDGEVKLDVLGRLPPPL
jgi:hypothetical protein